MNEVVVIGGGVAGAAVATWLAKRGGQVVLLEKEKGPHEKVCGSFLSPAAQYYLAELGLACEIRRAPSIRYLRLACGRSCIESPLPFQAVSLSRESLDELILRQATRAGASIRRGAKVSAVERESSYWRIDIAGHTPLYAQSVFLATGKHELRGWPRTGPEDKSAYIGFKQHVCFTGGFKSLSSTIDLHLFADGYVGLAPIEKQRGNLCLVVNRARFAACGGKWDEFFGWLKGNAPLLAGRLEESEPYAPRPLAIYGIPYGYLYRPRQTDLPGFYRLGDQMAVIPSYIGDGMAIALYTAFEAVHSYFYEDNSYYHKKAGRTLAPLIRKASFLSTFATGSLRQKVAFKACRLVPGLLCTLAGSIRLSQGVFGGNRSYYD